MGQGEIAPDYVSGFQRELERLGQFQEGWPQNTSLSAMCDSLNLAINQLPREQFRLVANRLGVETTDVRRGDVALEVFTILSNFLRHDVRPIHMTSTASRHHFPIAVPSQTSENPDFNFVSCALSSNELRIYSPDLLQQLLQPRNGTAWLGTVLYWHQFSHRFPSKEHPHLTLMGQTLVSDDPSVTPTLQLSRDTFLNWQSDFVTLWRSLDRDGDGTHLEKSYKDHGFGRSTPRPLTAPGALWPPAGRSGPSERRA